MIVPSAVRPNAGGARPHTHVLALLPLLALLAPLALLPPLLAILPECTLSSPGPSASRPSDPAALAAWYA